MKTSVKIFLICLSIIAGTLTLSFTMHNTYASKTEVKTLGDDIKTEIKEMRDDIKFIRKAVNQFLILLIKKNKETL